MVFQVKMDLPGPWVQEGLLVREDDLDFLGLQGLAVTMVLEAVTVNQVPLGPLELQDSLDHLVLRAKSGLQGPLVQVEPQEPEENLDLRDMPVLRDLLAPPGAMAVQGVKVKWVPLVFLEPRV